MATWFQSLRSLLVAETCYACERNLTSQEQYVCFGCLGQLQETGFQYRERDNELFFRLAGRVPLAGAASMFYFDKGGKLQTLLKALKYQDAPYLATYLGRYLAERMADSPLREGIEALVPVPLHRSKLRQRGYNQAERLARGIAERWDLPVRTDVLRRPRRTATQARQGGSARWQNVAGAFAAQDDLPSGILLIDDVITTGSTLEACIKALVAHADPLPPVKVLSLGLAREQ